MTDGTDHAIRAAGHARTLARLFDATVHVINVVDLDAEAGLFDAGGVPPAFVERLEEDGRNAIESVEKVVEMRSSRSRRSSKRQPQSVRQSSKARQRVRFSSL